MALLTTAKALEKAGVFAVLLEKVAENAAMKIRDELNILVFSIGAGRQCDGQLLLSCDILRSFDLFNIKFTKNYMTPEYIALYLERAVQQGVNDTGFAYLAGEAFKEYANDVRQRRFPEVKHIYPMKPGEFSKLVLLLKKMEIEGKQ